MPDSCHTASVGVWGESPIIEVKEIESPCGLGKRLGQRPNERKNIIFDIVRFF